MQYLGDIITIESFDGLTLEFPDPEFRLITYGNFGAPPTNWITRRGYKQHGVTEVDYLLDSRTIEVDFWHAAACNRQAYWDTRLALHNILRPNRGGPMTFTLRQTDGTLRALTVRADPGLTFPPDDSNNWEVRETLNFIAFDPIFFNPDQTLTSFQMAALTQTDLIFPITFPIVFGITGVNFSTGLFTYPGSWVTYPTFTLTGPYSSVNILNIQTNALLSLIIPIVAGNQRIIDLTPGSQRIVDGNGESRYNELSADSNLIDFNIRPDPEVPGGAQQILVTMFGGVIGQSSAHIAYFDRYFAI